VKGQKFICALYTYRSCAKAMPQMPSPPQELYMETYEVMKPEISKLKALMTFHEEAIQVFLDNLQALVIPEKRREVINEQIILCLVNLFDMLITLDALKNMKACLNNDFAFFKRFVYHIMAARLIF